MFGLFKSKEQIEAEAEQRRKKAEEEAEKRRQQAEATRLEREKEKRIEQEKRQQLKNDYETHRRDYGYTKGHNGIVTLRGRKFYAFVHDDHLKFFICQPPDWEYEGKKMPQWQKQSISLKNIRYFSKEGQVYSETRVSGGGSKGVNVGGAVVGAAIAGVPGAIIAGRAKTDPIETTTIKHDSRKTILVYNKGQLDLAPEDFNVLMRLIPDKEFSVVQRARAMREKKPSQNNNVQILKELKMMLDEDLITQAEYDTKKAEVLSRM